MSECLTTPPPTTRDKCLRSQSTQKLLGLRKMFSVSMSGRFTDVSQNGSDSNTDLSQDVSSPSSFLHPGYGGTILSTRPLGTKLDDAEGSDTTPRAGCRREGRAKLLLISRNSSVLGLDIEFSRNQSQSTVPLQQYENALNTCPLVTKVNTQVSEAVSTHSPLTEDALRRHTNQYAIDGIAASQWSEKHFGGSKDWNHDKETLNTDIEAMKDGRKKSRLSLHAFRGMFSSQRRKLGHLVETRQQEREAREFARIHQQREEYLSKERALEADAHNERIVSRYQARNQRSHIQASSCEETDCFVDLYEA